MKLNIHSTRLFPKGKGARAYALSGIASRCDWVVFSDKAHPQTSLFKNVATDSPRHIFLSLRAPAIALRMFVQDILPLLNQKFVLVTGSQDVTVPHQSDHRWPSFDKSCPGLISAILSHPCLEHWFAENLDDDRDTRFSPLPLGMVFPNGYPVDGLAVPTHRPLAEKPLRILCGHRVRQGPQWELRKRISQLAKRSWSSWCTILDEPVSEADFLNLMKNHAFVLCAEGGGLDPSPKAWQTILHGSIPIVRSTPTSSGYSNLPVAFVPEWCAENLTENRLRTWHARFAPLHDIPENRERVLERLCIDYWWERIREKACG